jgi:hypothetical protein
MDADERANRGRRAAHEFRELERAFQMVGDKLNRELLAATPGLHSDIVLAKHAQIHALGEVRKAMVAIIHDGQMAEATAEAAQG